METLQWTMEIPKDKQADFITFYKNTLSPTWKQFGALECKLHQVSMERAKGQDSIPSTQFIEILVLKIGLTSKQFFEAVKADGQAWEISRQYEKQFGAKNIILKVLKQTN